MDEMDVNMCVINKGVIANWMECMNGVLGHYSALSGYIGAGSTWANEMNFYIWHAPCAGLFIYGWKNI